MRGGRELLDAEHRRGDWDYLASDLELPRFSVVAGYCHRYAAGGSILELGCGEGLLARRLDASRYRRFVGVDVSPAVVERANRAAPPGATFVVADAEAFDPGEAFDAVVFNEVLEYFADPARLVRRYERWLAPGGVFIVSQYMSREDARTRRIWRMLRVYRRVARVRVSTTHDLTWIVSVLSPPPR